MINFLLTTPAGLGIKMAIRGAESAKVFHMSAGITQW